MTDHQVKFAVCALLSVAFAASLFIMWTILFRLRSHLISTSYKFIFAAKVCFGIMTGSGVYLIIWPLPERVLFIQLLWFSILSTGTICSAIGFWLYSRDVRAILNSASYTKSLPADASTHIHKSEPPSQKEV